MKKPLLSTILLMMLLATVQTIASPISKEEARKKAIAFMAAKGKVINEARLANTAPRKTVSTNNTDESNEHAAYYIFNTTTEGLNIRNEGFVIISGDDRTETVLGYSDKSSFSENNIPENLKAWLNEYARQIAALDRGVEPARIPVVGDAISSMLKTKWGQLAPYNNKCPLYNDSERCAAGCTATATAQIVYYHRHPQEGSTAIPEYVTASNRIPMQELPAMKFDWDNMVLGGDDCPKENDAVSTLMLYVGQAMKMNYSETSYSNTINAIKGMVDYFGYDINVCFKSRNNYTIEGWHNLIYNELKNNRPVLYGAFASGGGHSFVCDGYDGNGLFHINWGWDGNSDGYFALEVLNPYSSGTGAATSYGGYSFYQDCAIGLQPAMEGSVSEPKYLTSLMLTVSSTNLNCELYNYNTTSIEFDYGFGIIDNDGNIVEVLNEKSSTVHPRFSFVHSYNFSEVNLASGNTMKVVPVSREKGTEKWKSCVLPHEYALMTGDDKEKVGNITLYPHIEIVIDSVIIPERIFANQKFDIKVYLTNKGDECNRTLSFYAIDSDSDKNITEYEGLYIEKDAKGSITFSMKIPTAGNYSYDIQCLRDPWYQKETPLMNGEFTVEVEDPSTGIDEIMVEDTINDVLFYTLQGTRIDKPTAPGLYIHNGKVVFIR